MRLKDIQVGKFYETTRGVAKAIAVKERQHYPHPSSVTMEVQGAGLLYLSPRDVTAEVFAMCEPVASAADVTEEDPEKDERLTRKAADVAKGAETLQRVIEMTCDWLRDICKLNAMGFELTATVGDDGYLHLEKQG